MSKLENSNGRPQLWCFNSFIEDFSLINVRHFVKNQFIKVKTKLWTKLMLLASIQKLDLLGSCPSWNIIKAHLSTQISKT